MRNVYKVDNGGNVLIISIYSMPRKRLILSTSLRQKIVNREKVKPIGLEGASGRALDP